MEMDNIDFDSAFKMMSFSMNLNKTHPNIKRDFRWMWQTGILSSVSFFIFSFILYCTIAYDLKDGNITQAYANGITCLIYIVAALKFFIMLYYRDRLVDLIKKINLDYEKARHFPDCEKLIIQKFIQKGQVMTKTWFIVIIITSFLFILKPVGLMIYHTVFYEFKLVQLYEMTLPPAVEEIKDTWSMFILFFIMFLYYNFHSALMYGGLVPLGSVLTLHSCGQLELARSRILALFEKDNSDDDIIEEIKDVAKLLQDILSFTENIQVSYMILYELILKASSVAIPATLFQIIASVKKEDLRVEFVTIFFASIILSSIPCYYSDMLMEAGKNLNLAIYTCGWERRWNPRIRKMLFLLLVLTSKSTALRTVFLEISLESLTGVFQMAYTIFNLLNAL